MRPAPTVATVKEGIAKIAIKLEALRRETSAIREKLHAILPPDEKFKRDISFWYPSDGMRDQGKTPDPKRQIRELRWEYEDTSDFEIPTKVLWSIAKDLDGAFFDLSGIRSTINAIASDSDLRTDFKEYLDKNR